MIIQRLLATREVEIHCLCMRYHGQPLEEEIGGVFVHRFNVGPYFEVKEKALSRPGSIADKVIRIIDRVLLRVNQVLTIPIYPCFYPIRTMRYKAEAERLQKIYGFDIVACEHYGYETMMAGFNLKKRHPEVYYLQFFWDALSAGTTSGYLTQEYMDKKREPLEASIFKMADVSVALKSHRKALVRHDYANEAIAKGRLIFLGIPNLENVRALVDASPCDTLNNGCRNIVFAGNTYRRNVNFVARIVEACDDPSLRLWFITSSDLGELGKATKSTDSKIIVRPYMPHNELLGLMVHADALLNLGNPDVNAIPSKVTQYIGCCLPIISTYSVEEDTSRALLSDYPAALFLDERRTDFDKLANELCVFLDTAKDRLPDYCEVEKVYHDSTPDAYCELFDLPMKGDGSHR